MSLFSAKIRVASLKVDYLFFILYSFFWYMIVLNRAMLTGGPSLHKVHILDLSNSFRAQRGNARHKVPVARRNSPVFIK